MNKKCLNRRQFLRTATMSVPAGALVLGNTAFGQDMPKLDEADPAAKALLYVHDAANVDTANPMAARYEVGQDCANCAQIQGNDGDEWRGCGIFPGKLVAAAGWCSVWAPKA